MKKSEMAQEMARRDGVEPGEAADQIDRIVTAMLRNLRKGRAARLPGLGTITPGKRWTFRPETHES